MKVLIACEESQTVCKAFRARGHDAYSCDIIPCSGGRPEWHIQADVLDIMDNGDKTLFTQDGEIKYIQSWDMMIAHPPCTHLAVSGARWFKYKRQEQKEALAFVRKLLDAPIPLIALENPVSVISSKIRKPDQIIQPWQFGHETTKTTCLWLKGLPHLKPTNIVSKGDRVVYASGRSLPVWCAKTGKGCGKKRSVTFEGIAQAMAAQWG